MGVMWDATTPGSIPVSAGVPDYAMGYTNGAWPSYQGMKMKYPRAVPVAISAVPGKPNLWVPQGCDGERGDYDPEQAGQFCAWTIATGVVPFVYCSWSAWHDYQQGVQAAGINPNAVDWLIAAYPGIGPVPYPGSIGHQWIDRGTYDESAIVPGWVPGRPIGPLPPPGPPASTGKPFPIPGEDGQMNVPITYGNTGADGTAYVTVPIPAGCSKCIGASVDVADPGTFSPPQQDVDLRPTALDHSGAVAQPCVGAQTPNTQRVRLAGGAPNHFYTGDAQFA